MTLMCAVKRTSWDLNISRCAGGSLASWLVHQVPAKDSWVAAVGHSSDAVVAGGNGLHPVLVEGDGIGVREEIIAATGCGGVVGIVAPTRCLSGTEQWSMKGQVDFLGLQSEFSHMIELLIKRFCEVSSSECQTYRLISSISANMLKA